MANKRVFNITSIHSYPQLSIVENKFFMNLSGVLFYTNVENATPHSSSYQFIYLVDLPLKKFKLTHMSYTNQSIIDLYSAAGGDTIHYIFSEDNGIITPPIQWADFLTIGESYDDGLYSRFDGIGIVDSTKIKSSITWKYATALAKNEYLPVDYKFNLQSKLLVALNASVMDSGFPFYAQNIFSLSSSFPTAWDTISIETSINFIIQGEFI